MTKHISIIGGGIGGLATAALLAKDGYQVSLFEKNNEVGGRARSLQSHGFTFDLGPSWYMMPDVFDHFFSLFGKKTSDYFSLLKLDPHYKVYVENREYVISDDINQVKKLFDQIETGSGEQLQQFLNKSAFLYKAAMEKLVYFDYDSLGPLLSPALLFQIMRMKLFNSYHQEVTRYFKNPDLQKILEFMTVFLGGSPFITPAFYTLIAHTDFNLKIWHPQGGISKVIEALEALCNEYKVDIHVNEPVKTVTASGKKITSIITDKETYKTDIAIINADYAYAETSLLPPALQSYSSKYWSKKTLSPSTIMYYIGLDTKLKNIAHHCLYFDEQWETHFDDVYKNPTLPTAPSYYVSCPTQTDKTIAPPDNDALVFLIPIAAGLDAKDEDYRQVALNTVKHFEELTKQSILKHKITDSFFTPANFIADYNAYKGSAFGIAHTLFQTGPFRPRNKSNKASNLYYVGQYTNPGVGLPPCIISAQIVRSLIQKYEN